MVGILINKLVKEEDIARQRSLLDSNIFAELLRKSNVSCSLDSEQHTLFDLVALSCYIDPCVNKYAQTTDKNVDYHVYPSGKQVIKGLTANNFHFFDKNSQIKTELSDASIKAIDRVCITWRIRKNHQENQTVTLLSDKTNTTNFPLLAALCLVLRARCLSQPDSMPVVCHLKKDALAHIFGSRITILFWAAARAMHPNIFKEEEQQYSAQSLQVWACVLLNEAGNRPITSKNAFVGWAIPFGCTCVIHTSSRTSTARCFEHRPKRSWI